MLGTSAVERAAVTALLVSASACNPVYAPPVRATHYGAPSRLEAERMEIGGAAIGPNYPMVGGPHLAVGLDDAVSLEAGANLGLVAGGWGMGWLGVRITRAPEERVDWVGDLELGAGGGAGGAGASDAHWTELAALGGYFGFGLGARSEDVTVYLRSRLEVSAAQELPATLWPSAVLGIDGTIERTVSLGLVLGWAAYINSVEAIHGFVWQLQTAVLFDLPAPSAADVEVARPRKGFRGLGVRTSTPARPGGSRW